MDTRDLEPSQLTRDSARGTPGLAIVDSPDVALAGTFQSLARPLTLGRADSQPMKSEGALAIRDPRVSRAHATFRARADGRGCEVRDLGSHNGTFLEGRRVVTESAPFGSILRIGDTLIEVSLPPLEVAPHASLVGRSEPLMRLIDQIRRIASSDVSVLIEGETGTGKELVAEALHAIGGRPGRLVAINCAAVPPELAESYLFGHRKGAFTGATHDVEGVFERARDGTLLLDEIGVLRIDLQAKLLRVLESRQFTPLGPGPMKTTRARFLAATNSRLRSQVAAGTFREDLFARIAGIEIAVPPLRARRSDVPALLAHFLAQSAPGVAFRFSPNAMEALLLHDWPMNVRELRTFAGRLALAHCDGGVFRTADIATLLNTSIDSGERSPIAPPPASTAPERAELVQLLTEHKGNVGRVAGHYGKDRRQVYRWLAAHRLDPADFR